MPAPAFPYPSKIEALAQPVADAYAACTDDLLVNIAGRFNVNDLTLGSGEWRFKMLAQMGQLTQENIEIIAKHTGQNTKAVRDAIEQAAYTALDSVEPALKQAAKAGLLSGATSLPMSPRVQRVVENFQRQAVDKMNLVNTTMLESSLKEYQIGVNDVFAKAQQTMNQAAAQTVLGTTDRHTAVRQAIAKMARDGITGFYDKAGRRWSPEAYVNMDIGTTMHNTYVQSAMARNTDYGNDLVYAGIKQISRPLCYPWQGKVISMNGSSGMTTDLNDNPIRIYPVGETTYGEPAGLWGINCGHSCNVFIPSLSVIRGEVPDKKENDREYAITQAQRQLERNVRYAKRDAAMAKATGDKEAFEQAAAKVRRTEKDLRDFYDNTGRNPSLNRTRVVGYNKNVAGSVTQAESRQRQEASAVLVKRNESVLSKINANGEIANPMPEEEYHKLVARLKNDGITVKPADKDTAEFMIAFGAEATYSNGVITHLGRIPSASAMYEEIVHYEQARKYGELLESNMVELGAREVAAQRHLLKHGKDYGFSAVDFDDIKRNRDYWESFFKTKYGVAYDEAKMYRGI